MLNVECSQSIIGFRSYRFAFTCRSNFQTWWIECATDAYSMFLCMFWFRHLLEWNSTQKLREERKRKSDLTRMMRKRCILYVISSSTSWIENRIVCLFDMRTNTRNGAVRWAKTFTCKIFNFFSFFIFPLQRQRRMWEFTFAFWMLGRVPHPRTSHTHTHIGLCKNRIFCE